MQRHQLIAGEHTSALFRVAESASIVRRHAQQLRRHAVRGQNVIPRRALDAPRNSSFAATSLVPALRLPYLAAAVQRRSHRSPAAPNAGCFLAGGMIAVAQRRMPANERLLRRQEVEHRVGLKKSAIYQRIAKGAFPVPVPDEDGTNVRWLESEIRAYIAARKRARDAG
ncbi:AlpA family phage regulatory protein [Lysobacter sp. ISL-42]|nr:AlpA family phage regulatory protein [Lysobacter sp. ISL-42]MBT2752959.1 AlpA family phage regulatory protein [Lysobacter sp. ISL-50]MBT2778880.1 AlpA family phage regulatory protein [Lysobacter sp. ISL-54]MBT2784226.1 AlpA family phage regulatory protein [Lysobacter sp. ISL-52]